MCNLTIEQHLKTLPVTLSLDILFYDFNVARSLITLFVENFDYNSMMELFCTKYSQCITEYQYELDLFDMFLRSVKVQAEFRNYNGQGTVSELCAVCSNLVNSRL